MIVDLNGSYRPIYVSETESTRDDIKYHHNVSFIHSLFVDAYLLKLYKSLNANSHGLVKVKALYVSLL